MSGCCGMCMAEDIAILDDLQIVDPFLCPDLFIACC